LQHTHSLQAPQICSEHVGTARSFHRAARRAAQWTLLALIRFYIVCLSPLFGGTCKFYPSCSNYAWEAVARHGARRGASLALKRLLRCHPFTKGGVDLVPEASEGAPIVRHGRSQSEAEPER